MKITGVILAGGKSSRMGTDKGILEVNGKRMIEYVIDALKPNVEEIIIIANNANYNNLGYKVYEDILKDCGPMGGIFTALKKSEAENNFVMSCDMPYIPSTTIEYIISKLSDEDALVPIHKNQVEPLCAIYKKSTAEDFEQFLNSGNYKLRDGLKSMNTSYLEMSEANGFHDGIFTNINTPQELTAQKVK